MEFYDSTVFKVNLDTGGIKMSDFLVDDEMTVFSEVPQSYIDEHDEFTEGLITEGATLDLEEHSYIYTDRGEGLKWYFSEDDTTFGARFFSALRYKTDVEYL